MRRIQNTTSKRTEAEARVGLPLAEYFDQAVREGVTQGAMAKALGVSRVTVSTWMRDLGFKSYIIFRRDKRRSAA